VVCRSCLLVMTVSPAKVAELIVMRQAPNMLTCIPSGLISSLVHGVLYTSYYIEVGRWKQAERRMSLQGAKVALALH